MLIPFSRVQLKYGSHHTDTRRTDAQTQETLVAEES